MVMKTKSNYLISKIEHHIENCFEFLDDEVKSIILERTLTYKWPNAIPSTVAIGISLHDQQDFKCVLLQEQRERDFTGAVRNAFKLCDEYIDEPTRNSIATACASEDKLKYIQNTDLAIGIAAGEVLLPVVLSTLHNQGLDAKFECQFSAQQIKEALTKLFPCCNQPHRDTIARKITNERWSGLKLATVIHIIVSNYIRHSLTDYDMLLKAKLTREEALFIVDEEITEITNLWYGKMVRLPLSLRGKRKIAQKKESNGA